MGFLNMEDINLFPRMGNVIILKRGICTPIQESGGVMKTKILFKSIKQTKKYAYARNPYGRRGKPTFMKSVIKGMENFLASPFK